MTAIFSPKGLLTLLIGLVVGAIAVFGVLNFVPMLKGDDTTRTVTSATVDGGFQHIAELSVEEYHFTHVGRYEESRLGPFGVKIPFTNKHFLLTYDGKVAAGIKDFEAIDVTINDLTKEITITAPAVEITHKSIDHSSVVSYDESLNPFNPITAEDVPAFLAGEQQVIEEKAARHGLLERAAQRAEDMLKTHVRSTIAGTDAADYAVSLKWKN